jgi:hypothetical protein
MPNRMLGMTKEETGYTEIGCKEKCRGFIYQMCKIQIMTRENKPKCFNKDKIYSLIEMKNKTDCPNVST